MSDCYDQFSLKEALRSKNTSNLNRLSSYYESKEKDFKMESENYHKKRIALDYNKTKTIELDWPPYLSDFNYYGCFIWSSVKDRIYKCNFKNTKDLKRAIIQEFSKTN
ncbi:hypothetical protein RF11_06690 [Thelohanellus kitauei]|uniref:Uncharacterized protein n=1 Tax=Thelohanellus kitauei TaxID=669202 RepID=A0A0C2MXD1_THEKT|nr:hypothetical protein RF11_06690 [Thelohanellus kitauei]